MVVDFEKIDIRVNDTPIKATLQELMKPSDTQKTAHGIAYWSNVLAEAECEAARVDAHYRAWRAEQTEIHLKKDGKLSEWKVRARIENHPTFAQFKEGAAVAARNVRVVQGIVDAFKSAV